MVYVLHAFIAHAPMQCSSHGKTKTKKVIQKEVVTTNADYEDDELAIEHNGYDSTSTDETTSTDQKQDSELDEFSLSQYEMERMARIERNKRKFEEIFGKTPKDTNFPRKKKRKTKKVNLM